MMSSGIVNRRMPEVVGIVPCGGYATRIAPLPCSKEILPVAIRTLEDGTIRPKAVSHYVLERMRAGGVRRIYFVLRKGKWDIPEYYGDGHWLRLDLAYLIARLPHGPAYTLDQAYPFVRGMRVAMGFPDIIFEPEDGFELALNRLTTSKAELVLGLVTARHGHGMDLVDVDQRGRVRDLLIQSQRTLLNVSWIFAVWGPAFTEYLHHYLSVPRTRAQSPGKDLPVELTIGHVIQAAIRDDLHVQSVPFMHCSFLDIGTADGLVEAFQRVAHRRESSLEVVFSREDNDRLGR